MGRRILIIEDEKNICALLQDYLSDEGFDVRAANDLASGRLILTEEKLPDLLILDVMLPDGNGFDYLKDLRSSPHTHGLPIIIMSAHKVDVQDRVDGFDLGADDYLVKPFDLREMKSRIERLLKRVDRNHALSVDLPPPPRLQESSAAGSIEDVLKTVIEKKAPARPSMAPSPRPAIAAAPEEPAEPLFKKWAQLLLEPQKFMTSWARKTEARVVLGALLIWALGWGIQKGIEEKSGVMALAVMAAVAAGGAAFMYGAAWLIQWRQGLKGKRLPLKALADSLGLLFVPVALAAVIGVIYVIGAQGRMGDFTLGPALFFPTMGTKGFVGILLRHLDFFELWGLWLAWRGFKASRTGSAA